MSQRDEYEADLFRRYESRIVALEIQVDVLEGFVEKYGPLVDALREAALVAEALSVQLERARRGALTKAQVCIAIAALFTPPVLTAVLLRVLGKG